jgi:hypothetical protein
MRMTSARRREPQGYGDAAAGAMLAVRTAVIAGVAALAACASAPLPESRFTRPLTTQEQYLADQDACYRESGLRISGGYINAYTPSTGVVHSRSAWLTCMVRRGYVTDPKGLLVPPPGREVYFQRP